MDNGRGSTWMPGWLVAIAFLGAAAALAGGFWDDSWHTERGRDDFFIAPHIAIYAGVTAVGAAIGLWVLLEARRRGVGGVLRNPVMLLAAVSVAVTLASAPIDNFWHESFGRDAVAWSPPHMLGVVGMLGLAAALLTILGDRRLLGPATGALVFAAATFAVFEYDTDVPQFDAVWYLPVLALGAAIAATLVHLRSPRPWAAGTAAFGHLVFLGGASLFLVAIGFPALALPLLLFPALALDVARQRNLGPAAQSAVFVGALYAAYVPVRNLLGDGVFIDALDVAVGLPLALVAVGAVFHYASDREGSSGREAASAMPLAGACLLLLGTAPVAVAHDPGQGDPAGTMRLEVTASDGGAQLNGTWGAPRCESRLEGGELVARRAGQELRAPLELRGCSFRGAVSLPDRGRWFVYADLRSGDGRVESWLPVHNASQPTRTRDPRRYAYVPAQTQSANVVKYLAGGVLYTAIAVLLFATIAVSRRRPAEASVSR